MHILLTTNVKRCKKTKKKYGSVENNAIVHKSCILEWPRREYIATQRYVNRFCLFQTENTKEEREMVDNGKRHKANEK